MRSSWKFRRRRRRRALAAGAVVVAFASSIARAGAPPPPPPPPLYGAHPSFNVNDKIVSATVFHWFGETDGQHSCDGTHA